MATYIIKGNNLRINAAKITQGLRKGDDFILLHYQEPVGYISSEVPKKLLKEAKAKEKEELLELE